MSFLSKENIQPCEVEVSVWPSVVSEMVTDLTELQPVNSTHTIIHPLQGTSSLSFGKAHEHKEISGISHTLRMNYATAACSEHYQSLA